MSVFFLVVLSVVNAASSKPPSSAIGRSDRLDCGRYQIAGILGKSDSGINFIQVYAGTPLRFDIVVSRIDVDDEIGYLWQNVRMDIYVTKSGAVNEARARAIGRVEPITPREAAMEPIRSIEKMSCAAIPSL